MLVILVVVSSSGSEKLRRADIDVAGYSETITYDVIEEIDFDSINYLVLINADGDAGGVVGEVDEDGDVEGVDEVEEDYVEEDE
jgi:hypothetical protein